jgi:hypothetical protein
MKYILLSLVFSSLIGCASFKDKYEHDKVAKVHRVAILSFEIIQEQPTDNIGISAFTKGAKSSITRTGQTPELKDMAKKVYTDLQAQLNHGLAKPFVSAEKIIDTPAYKEVYQQKMTGLKHQTMGSKKSENIWVDGILDQVNFRKLTFAEKVKLAKSVGADAFVEYLAYQTIDQPYMSIGHLSGNASFQFTTRSNLLMYSIDSEEPIWQNQNLDGQESRSSKDLEGQTVLQKLSTIGFESARSSIHRFGESLASYKR